ncbi:MAG: hypothetical protein Q9162_000209 [Coniocarpon cinnabarinum]
MLRRASSHSSTGNLLIRRPSFAPSLSSRGRRGSQPAIVEDGQNDPQAGVDEVIHDEIDEIKRYEDFTTIDWVQDAAREQMRKRARRQEQASFFEREGRIVVTVAGG